MGGFLQVVSPGLRNVTNHILAFGHLKEASIGYGDAHAIMASRDTIIKLQDSESDSLQYKTIATEIPAIPR